MKFTQLVKYAFVALVCGVLFGACDSAEKEPENDLKLTASAQTVGPGVEITFKVTHGSMVVTSKAQVKSLSEGGKVVTGAWSSETSGQYRFVAEYDGMTSAEIVCSVAKYQRASLGIEFTSPLCQYCPQMTASLTRYESENPGKMIVMAAHVLVGENPLATDETLALADKFGVRNSAPELWVDYQGNLLHYTYPLIQQGVQKAQANYPALSDLSVVSAVEGRKVTIHVKGRFDVEAKFRAVVALLEDGIVVNGGNEKVYNHVIRKFATDIMGTSIGLCTPDKEYEGSFTIDADASWNLDKCRVVVALLKEESGKDVWAVNSAKSCSAVGTVDFQ